LEHPQGWPWYSGRPTSFQPGTLFHGVGKSNNNRDNAMTTESNAHHINFKHGENGVINTYNGSTIFSNLFMLGAFAHTREYDKKIFHGKYQTDVKGLESLELKTHEAIDTISNIVAALGEMLAHTDLENIDKGTLATYGWLISGLGELQGQISFENREIAYALEKYKALYESTQSE
jgi:hypothetical protein